MAEAAFEVVALERDDDAALDELLAFAATCGRPRATTAAAYRDLISGDVVAWQAFVARDVAGEIAAAAQATVSPAIGLDQVQLNGFMATGEQAAFVSVLDAVNDWAREQGGRYVTAHVSAPTDEAIAAWLGAGYEQVGERARVTREVTTADAELAPVAVEGITIASLEDRPELEASADELWRIAHDDVPSALRFSSADVPPLRTEAAAGEAFPWSVLVAIDDTDRVVGLAVGIARYADRPTVVGHRMTATTRDWRGRGVSTALKVELIRRAATRGTTLLEASNDSTNPAMIAINDRLGYQPDYRLVLMRRAVR